jgi:Effector-associated domain 11
MKGQIRHLKFTYDLIMKQNIASKKKIFLRIHPGFNGHLYDRVSEEKMLGWLDKYEIDKINETVTLYYTGKGYEEFYSEMVVVLTFEKTLEDIILNEKSRLVGSIEETLWTLSKTDFIDYLIKIKNELRFIKIHLEKYEEAKKLAFIEKIITEISEYIDNKFGKNYEFLNSFTQPTNNVNKKQLITLIAESKIDELFTELSNLGLFMDNIEILLLSSRWNNIRQDLSKGILERDKYDLEANKIIKTLAEFIKTYQ